MVSRDRSNLRDISPIDKDSLVKKDDTVYTVGDNEFTYAQIKEAAKASNMSTQEYMKNVGAKKK